MEQHTKFAAHAYLGCDGKKNNIKRWKELSETLNLLGPNRDVSSWQEVKLNIFFKLSRLIEIEVPKNFN